MRDWLTPQADKTLFEQLDAQDLFELTYLSADGAGRDGEFIGGGRHPAEPGSGFECAQGIQWWQMALHCEFMENK